MEELKLLRKEYSDRRNVELKLPHSPLFAEGKSGEGEGEKVSAREFRLLEMSVDFRFQKYLYFSLIDFELTV